MYQELHTSDVIYIAAADSAPADKEMADFVCTGKNDQDVIQAVIDSIPTRCSTEVRGLRIQLLPGNFYISAFPRKNDHGRVAVMTGPATNSLNHIGILIAGSAHTESTMIHVDQEGYDSVGPDESCSIFGCEINHGNGNHHVFKDLYVTVPDDQKNIICFDGRNMGSLGLRRCKCLCDTRGVYLRVKDRLPVEGFVAFMGTEGSNNMWEEKWEFCQAEGFGQGFAVGSEHLLMHKCTALFGRYGFTFNNYDCHEGVIAHPMTLLACIDEANANLWKFAKNKFRQVINGYNISFERFPSWFELEGHRAVEERPGDYCGHIDFVANQGCDTPNDPAEYFWEPGSGIGFETVNNAHKKVCSTAERRTYAANLGQEIFDTDLNKKVIFIGDRWVDLMGNDVD